MPIIELIGAINGQQNYEAVYIADLLSVCPENLEIGTAFTGRPETRIFANARDVAKIRAELDLNQQKARRWTEKILLQEREFSIHHPCKTWFISTDPESESIRAGSICPRLKPLNIELKASTCNEEQRAYFLYLLEAVFTKYLLLAKNSGYKMDEGLSNFAVDDHGEVFYVDDELYLWDNFISFSVMLGVYIRSFDWLDPEFMAQLSRTLAQSLDDIFQDPHCRVIIASQLQTLFMPTPEKEALLQQLINSLSRTPVSVPIKNYQSDGKSSTKTPKNNRYYALFADIHANYAALDCVLDFYRQRQIDQGLVLGDIVGYGPEPKECIERLQASSFTIIKGNHDHAVATGNTSTGFSGNAKVVIDWTSRQLSRDDRDWLQNLPASARQDNWLAVHGAPIDPAFFYGYVYMMTSVDNLDYMQNKNIPLCFHGHSHMPGVYCRDKHNMDQHLTAPLIMLDTYSHALVCPGSVGQPRNGNKGAQCAIYDREKHEIAFFSLPYEVDPVVQKMISHDLPKQLWQRLLEGK